MKQDPIFCYSTMGVKTNICAESMKMLETKFQKHMESAGGLKQNTQVVKVMG
jgi:hypothetical protein